MYMCQYDSFLCHIGGEETESGSLHQTVSTREETFTERPRQTEGKKSAANSTSRGWNISHASRSGCAYQQCAGSTDGKSVSSSIPRAKEVSGTEARIRESLGRAQWGWDRNRGRDLDRRIRPQEWRRQEVHFTFCRKAPP